MKKIITFAALAGLAFSSQFETLSDNELNLLRNIGNGLKKAGEFIAKHPEIITTTIKILALEDVLEDNELFTKVNPRKEKPTKEEIQRFEAFIEQLKRYQREELLDNEFVDIAPVLAFKPIPVKDIKLLDEITSERKYVGFDQDDSLFLLSTLLANAENDHLLDVDVYSLKDKRRRGFLGFEEE